MKHSNCFLICLSYCLYFCVNATSVAAWQIEWECTEVAPIEAFAINSKGHVFAFVGKLESWSKMFRSTDNGGSWIEYDYDYNEGGAPIVIDSDDNIFVGTTGGVLRSRNNGESWDKLDMGLFLDVVEPDSQINRIVLYPYALIINSRGKLLAGTNLGVFLSTNDGENWVETSTGLKYKEPSELPTWRYSKVAAFATDARGHIFAATDKGIFRSTNNGKTWTSISKFKGVSVSSLIVVADQQLLLGTIMWGVYRSIDGGRNWGQTSLHHATFSVARNSIGHIFAATSEGVFRSTNNGRSWSHIGLQDRVNAVTIDLKGFIYAASYKMICRSAKSTIHAVKLNR